MFPSRKTLFDFEVGVMLRKLLGVIIKVLSMLYSTVIILYEICQVNSIFGKQTYKAQSYYFDLQLKSIVAISQFVD